jgi:hypothetical protein
MSEGGCTNCGRKGGCDHRKSGMFAAIEAALLQAYPTRRWSDRADHALPGGVGGALGRRLSDRLAAELKTMSLYLPGGSDEYCDYVYVLCFGREPSLIGVRAGLSHPDDVVETVAGVVEELYLRVALSTLVPFAAVQQVAVRAEAGEGTLFIEEAPRAGVFDPVLLPRFQKLVKVLAELEIRHLDFGEINEPPPGFDAGDYGERYGGAPAVANYFFYPAPSSSITTTLLSLAVAGVGVPGRTPLQADPKSGSSP